MDIHEIENSSFAELKANRDALVETAKKVPMGDLAIRYIQARTDAKGRDDKLAEQALTLKLLKDALTDLKAKSEAAAVEAAETNRDLSAAVVTGEREWDAFQSNLKKVAKEALDNEAKLIAANARADRMKGEALRNFKALSSASKLLADAMAQHVTETANLGE